MSPTRKWLLIYGVALIAFGWGLTAWLGARLYEPSEPAQALLRSFSFHKPEPSFPLTRYQSLTSGSLFFGVNDPGVPEFKTNLVLWGIIQGRVGAAVVGIDPASNAHTWVVRVGELVQEERLLAIGENYITVRNSTGEGRVYISN